MILAFDTSLPFMSVALIDDGVPVASMIMEGRRSRNEKLLPAIDFLLRETGHEPGGIDTIVVTRGPGSFTGVRIGLATAQGLALSTGASIIAMPTHDGFAGDAANVAVLGDAGRDEVYLSRYDHGEPSHATVIVAREQLDAVLGDHARIEVDRICRERNVALLCAARAIERRIEPGEPHPLYVRESAAEERLRDGSG